MIAWCARGITGWLIRCGAVRESDRELYVYAAYSFLITVILNDPDRYPAWKNVAEYRFDPSIFTDTEIQRRRTRKACHRMLHLFVSVTSFVHRTFRAHRGRLYTGSRDSSSNGIPLFTQSGGFQKPETG